MKVALGDILRPLGRAPSSGHAADPVFGVSTDSRSVAPGELFVAIKGPRFDGHDFIPAVLERGACAAVAGRSYSGPDHERVYRVDDTLNALGDIARWYRRALKARVVAITGSNGKTTTKEMTAHILSGSGRVVRARGSFNNAIGVPLTIFSADERTEYLVLEIGTNNPGEVRYLGEIAAPDVAAITSISAAHLEGLGSIEGIVLEKSSLLDCLSPGGVAVVNKDLPWYGRIRAARTCDVVTFGSSECDVGISRVTREGEGVSFILNGSIPVRLNIVGQWNAWNAACAIAVCGRLGVPPEEAARTLADFRPPYMRMERVERGGVLFFNDAYNANPASMAGALEEFHATFWKGRKVAVLGDMLELGAESRRLHEEIAEGMLRRSGPEIVVVTVGQDSRAISDKMRAAGRETAHFDDTTAACRVIGGLLRKGDLVLLKASRGIGLERILDRFQ